MAKALHRGVRCMAVFLLHGILNRIAEGTPVGVGIVIEYDNLISILSPHLWFELVSLLHLAFVFVIPI